MPKQRKNPTIFFLVIIAGACILLLALLFGFAPNEEGEDINENANTYQEIEVQEDGAGGGGVDIEDELSNFTVNAFDEIGLNVRFPGEMVASWGGDAEIVNVSLESGGKVTLLPKTFEGEVRHSINVELEEGEPVTVGGMPGVLISGNDVTTGEEVTEILVTVDDQLYVFMGDDEFIENVQTAVEFVL